MSGPIIEEIQDDMKQLELAPSEKRQLTVALKKLDEDVSLMVRNLQNEKLTEKQANTLMAAINAKRFISSEKADTFLDDYQRQVQKLEPEQRVGFLIIFDALASMRNQVLAIEAARQHKLQIAAYKAGKNPLAINEMKLANEIDKSTFTHSALAALGLSSISMFALHKSTTSIDIVATALKKTGDILSSYQACATSSEASWLSYDNLVCGVANKVLEPVAKASGSLTSSIGTISADLREGGILFLGIILFLGLLVFIVSTKKIISTKKLAIAFLGGVETRFSGNRKMRRSLRKKVIRKSKKTRK